MSLISFKKSTPLQIACLQGNFQKVKELLDNQVQFEENNVYKLSLLYEAVSSKNESVINLLLNKVCSINTLYSLGASILHEATKCGDVKVFEYLIEKGAKIDEKDRNSQTPLFSAVRNSNVPIVEFFIKKGLNVNDHDKNGMIPLHLAAQEYDHPEVVEVLLNAGSELERKDYQYLTPFFWSVLYENISVVKLLIAEGANVNAEDYNGRIPLHIAAGRSHIELVTILLNAGSDVHHEDDNGETPLFYAVNILKADDLDLDFRFSDMLDILKNRSNDNCCTQLLLDAGARVNAKSEIEVTPIYYAIRYNSLKKVESLLNAGARIDFALDYMNSLLLEKEPLFEINEFEMNYVFVENLFKLQLANMNVDESLFEQFFEYESFKESLKYDSLAKSCRLEVEKMKRKCFGNVLLYEVLVKTDDPIFTDNIEMEKYINSCDFKMEFQEYGALLKSKFLEAKERNNLLKFVTCNINFNEQPNISVIPLPNEIKRQIFCYLNNEELGNLKIAFSNTI